MPSIVSRIMHLSQARPSHLCTSTDMGKKAATEHQIGYDEGGFSAATGLSSFTKSYGLDPSLWKDDPTGLADRKANISSFGVLSAALGAIEALALTDRLGRLRSWKLFILWWATGNLVQTFSSGIVGLMLFGRIWGVIGAGGCTVVDPLFLSEIAPAKSRGSVVSVYMVILLTSLALGRIFFWNNRAHGPN